MKNVFLPFKAVFNSSVPHLRVAIVQVEPYVNKRRVGDQVEVWGPLSQVAEAIQIITGHKLTAVSIEDMPHGFRLENGSFYGIMGMFERGEVDLFMSPAIMTDQRLVLAEPAAFEITKFQLLTWSPLKVVDPFNFAFAFKLEVWLGVFSSFVLLSLFCWIIDRYLTPWDETKPVALTEYLWDLFSRFFPQDAPLQQQHWFRMNLIGFLFAFSFIFMTFLSSALTSSMTIKIDEDSVNSYADVLRFPEVRIYGEKGTLFVQAFTHPHNELFRKLGARLIPVRGIFKLSPNVMKMVTEIEGRTRVMTASPVICKAVVIEKKKISGKCPNVMLSTESAGLMTISLFISKNLPADTREAVQRAILIALESYIYRKPLLWSMEEYEKCQLRTRPAAASTTKALSLHDVQGCFVLFAIGTSAASFAFFSEIARKRFAAALAHEC